jgi:predicted nucleic acid-binding protein
LILVDSSVWVSYFNGQESRETERLDALLGREPVAIGDLILTEVLQGFREDRDYRTARSMLTGLTIYNLLDAERAVRVADNYRALRRRGITVRKTADAIIATFCIDLGLPLLFSDKDFEPFVRHLGLRSAFHSA